MNTTQHRKNWQLGLLMAFCFAIFFAACKQPGTDPELQLPTITSVNPVTAPVGGTIVITGTNFSSPPTSNTVTINGIPATIVTGTGTTLVVQVPAGANNGTVVVTTAAGTVQGTTPVTVSAKPVIEVEGTIRENQSWTRDKVYLLRGNVYVATDFTLTVEAGTVIRGAGPERDPEGRNQPGTLIIERRGKLIATGTAAQPIVFTSAKPAGQRNYGDWGGIIFIGKSPINRSGSLALAGTRSTIETYDEPFDNSGTLQYVRVEFAGATLPALPTTTTLNGLTLYGVGSGTIIDHVQVSYSGGDAFAWFGGTANAKYLVAHRTQDADWNSDQGYTGKVQFGVALRDPDVADPSTSNSIESQNFDGTGENAGGVALTKQNGFPQTAPIFANLSSFAFGGTPNANKTARGGAYQAAMYLRGNTAISVYNSVFVGYPEGLRLEGTTTGTLANATANRLDLRGVTLANTLTPLVGAGDITNDQATAYFLATGRSNQLVTSAQLASLLLDATTFNLTRPTFVPLAGSPLLSSGVTTGKVADLFFTPTTYRGAFSTDNWLQGWTNFDPQTTDYDR